MQVETKLPKVLKVPLLTAETPPTDRGTKQKNRPQPSDIKSTDTLLPRSSQTYTEEMEKEKAVTASSLSTLLERENFETHSEIQQNEEKFFVTEVI